MRERQRLFDGAFAWSSTRFNLAQGGQTELVDGMWASGGLFDVLGVPAMLGRTFTEADDRRGGGPDGPVAVISYGFWQRRFGGAADAIGRSLTVERVPFTIVGVAPPRVLRRGRRPDVRRRDSDRHRAAHPRQGVVARSALELVAERHGPAEGRVRALEAGNAALRGVQPQIREATMPQDWRPQDKDELPQGGLLADSRGHRRLGPAPALPPAADDHHGGRRRSCC